MSKSEEIINRFENAKKRKVVWEETYEEALEYVSPQRETFDTEFKGSRKDGGNRVFDSTSQNALFKYASNIQSSLTPPMKRWVELTPGPSLKSDKKLKKTLQNITEIMFSNLHNSNFDTQIAESFLDLGIGTGAILAFKGTKEKPFNFVNVPLSQLYLEEGPYCRVDTSFRYFELSPRNITKQWEDANLNEDLQTALSENPDKPRKFIEATIPEKIIISEVSQDETRQVNQREVDGFKYYVLDEASQDIIVEREMRSSPWIIFRWANLPGEIYGRGPALTALPDIKTLNKTKELLLQAASMAIFGMWTLADDGVINIENIKFGPGAVIPVSSNPGSLQGPSLSPLPTPGNPDLAQIIINDLRNSVNEMLFADALGPVDLPVKTATEISIRQQELAKRIGSAFGKLQYELISPLINRLLDILDELGLIDLGPFRVDGNVISINHVSPLAMAQDEEDVVRHIRYAEILTGLFGPEMALMLMQPDKFSTLIANKLNIDEGVSVDPKASENIRNMVLSSLQSQQ